MKSFFLGFLGSALAMLLLRGPLSVSAQSPASETLRVRNLVIIDEKGRDRIWIGAPLPDARGQAGLSIRDESGMERIGFGVNAKGDASLGLDAPKGKGDDRNRERIVLEADGNGGAEIALFNRKTFIASRLKLRGDETWEFALRKQDGKKIRGRRMIWDKDEPID